MRPLTHRSRLTLLAAALLTLVGCGESATLDVKDGSGPQPVLPAPHGTLLPTVKIAKAVGWPSGARPMPAEGLAVQAFAKDLDHPRWLAVMPNGDVLVAETNAPPRPQDSAGFKGWVADRLMTRAGATVPSADRITLLRDTDGDGVADVRSVLLDHLHSPFGMAKVGDTLYVANTDAVMAFPFHDGETRITAPGRKLIDLPAGPLNHHWTKNLIASPDGRTLYVTIGSNSNVGENGLEAERDRARIEGTKVVGALTHADRVDGKAEALGSRDEDAAARRSVELGHDQAGDIGGLTEGFDLGEGVLAGRCVEDQKHVVRGVGIEAAENAADLGQLLHQVGFVLHPAGGVDDQDVDALGGCLLDAVVPAKDRPANARHYGALAGTVFAGYRDRAVLKLDVARVFECSDIHEAEAFQFHTWSLLKRETCCTIGSASSVFASWLSIISRRSVRAKPATSRACSLYRAKLLANMFISRSSRLPGVSMSPPSVLTVLSRTVLYKGT